MPSSTSLAAFVILVKFEWYSSNARIGKTEMLLDVLGLKHRLPFIGGYSVLAWNWLFAVEFPCGYLSQQNLRRTLAVGGR